jgi:hypothetical protein
MMVLDARQAGYIVAKKLIDSAAEHILIKSLSIIFEGK